jgi:hypothetical protein
MSDDPLCANDDKLILTRCSNEANPFTENWKADFWGPNYDKLLHIKKKYDPEGILQCWKCVGYDESEELDPRYACQGRLQDDVNTALSQN